MVYGDPASVGFDAHHVSQTLGTATHPVDLGTPKVYHIPAWKHFGDPKKLALMRRIIEARGRDPRMAVLAVNILREAGVEPRDYVGQAAALLKWVQYNIYYVNEPDERLQDPEYTLKVRMGDCDDEVILLCTLYESLRFSWRLVLSGAGPNDQVVRWVEGTPMQVKGKWSHIYCCVGDRPFAPRKWYFAEPTLRGVPLDWDIVGAGGRLPEFATTQTRLAGASDAAAVSAAMMASDVAADESKRTNFLGLDWQQIATAVIIGVTSGVLTRITLKAVLGDEK